jgi:hypothetical protein
MEDEWRMTPGWGNNLEPTGDFGNNIESCLKDVFGKAKAVLAIFCLCCYGSKNA